MCSFQQEMHDMAMSEHAVYPQISFHISPDMTINKVTTSEKSKKRFLH